MLLTAAADDDDDDCRKDDFDFVRIEIFNGHSGMTNVKYGLYIYYSSLARIR